MRKLACSIILLIFLLACQQRQSTKLDKPSKEFSVQVDSLKIDAPILAGVWYEGYLLCLKENAQFLVLDVDLKENTIKQGALNALSPNALFLYRDTVMIGGKKALYYLDKGFEIKPLSSNSGLPYKAPLYADENYTVTACSMGEFGSTVSFISQRDGKHYSYPSNAIKAVLKHGDSYIASGFLAHGWGLASFLEVKDPTKLYELRNEYSRRYCNWQMNDSILALEGIKLNEKHPTGVTSYFDTSVSNLSTFICKGDLYTIFSNDTVTLLAKHTNHKLEVVDTLREHFIRFQYASSLYHEGRMVTAYSKQIGTVETDSTVVTRYNTGLIVAKGNEIFFVDGYGIKNRVEITDNKPREVRIKEIKRSKKKHFL